MPQSIYALTQRECANMHTQQSQDCIYVTANLILYRLYSLAIFTWKPFAGWLKKRWYHQFSQSGALLEMFKALMFFLHKLKFLDFNQGQ